MGCREGGVDEEEGGRPLEWWIGGVLTTWEGSEGRKLKPTSEPGWVPLILLETFEISFFVLDLGYQTNVQNCATHMLGCFLREAVKQKKCLFYGFFP